MSPEPSVTVVIPARFGSSRFPGKPLALIAGLKQELEFPQPARPGDRLSLTSECVAKRVSESKPERGIVTFQAEITNQKGVPVLRMKSVLLLARRPAV